MIPDWLKKPEVIYTTVLFVISVGFTVGFSLYPSEIRGLMKLPGKGMRSEVLRRLEGELQVMTSLHDDGYRLLLWALWHVVDTLKKIFQFVVFAAGVNLIAGLIWGHPLWTGTVTGVVSPTFGVLIGHWRITNRIVNALLRFDDRKAELEREIALLKGSAVI